MVSLCEASPWCCVPAGEVLLLMHPRPSATGPVWGGVAEFSGPSDLRWSKVLDGGLTQGLFLVRPASTRQRRRRRGGPHPGDYHDICETRRCQSSSGMRLCEIARIRCRFSFPGTRRAWRHAPPAGEGAPIRAVRAGRTCDVDAVGPQPGSTRLDSTPCLLFPLMRSHGLRHWLGLR